MKIFIREKIDSLLILIFSLVELTLIILDVENIVRGALGFLLISFFPGYMIMRFFLHDRQLFFRTLILSIPVSLAISVIIGMACLEFYPQVNQTILQASIIAGFISCLSALQLLKRDPLGRSELGIFGIFVTVLVIAVIVSLTLSRISESKVESALYFEGIGDEIVPIEIEKDAYYDLSVGVDLAEKVDAPLYLQCSDNLLSEVIQKGGATYQYPVRFISHSVGLHTLQCELKSASKTLVIKIDFNVLAP